MKTYTIRQATRPDRDGCTFIVRETGKASMFRTEVWTWTRESAEAIKAALVASRTFGSELYF